MIRAACCQFRVWYGRLTLLAGMLSGFSPTTLIAQNPRAVTVVGLDYAFQAPDTLPAGPVTLSFINRGIVRHELILYRLNEGRGAGEFLRSNQEERQKMGRPLGIIFADSGQPAGAQLTADLTRGRSYVLLCVIRDAPDKPPHMALGMAKVVMVK